MKQQDLKLSAHFNLREFVFDPMAFRYGIDNYPPAPVIDNLVRMAKLLEFARTAFNKPPMIISGYRCLELNRWHQSSDKSSHIKGLGVDFVLRNEDIGKAALTLAVLMDRAFYPYDQIILEYAWIHISLAETGTTPRTMKLTKPGKDSPWIQGIHPSKISVSIPR